MKLSTWNVNGIRSVLNKGALQAYLAEAQPDILCLQETKALPAQVEYDFEAEGYHIYWNSAVKKGYSGTAILTKKVPLSVTYGIGIEVHDQEGRVITAEFAEYYLVTVYTPNAKRDLSRLAYRQQWEDDFLAYIEALNAQKPVVFCGDLNVAHTEIDLANPKTNTQNAGFTMEERAKFSQVVAAGYTDAFRYKYPEVIGAYTWWSYMAKARERNIGWRIDYFVVSQRYAPQIKEVVIRDDVMGSDHCPVELYLM
ncbi:exodeoxyribonuclease III [Aerococcaceae bacterium NML191292]|nr:exodeoxyribonuclease III [Aerococcaceae bacterium NML191292]MCW6662859.1 exodeoxyribonuclease III [Aerococcaceae bacterium NML190073]MCW6664198.1 exodeoxyribonuclease III [Aerococcaceae bacterium NML191219]MCW6674710.1 exodeoxyribonuclease III [Aerococcaceae bacterium NML171108]MCW6681345.1 exodeoxyribonuclease III [Aerococcaceae bacterium NML160702]